MTRFAECQLHPPVLLVAGAPGRVVRHGRRRRGGRDWRGRRRGRRRRRWRGWRRRLVARLHPGVADRHREGRVAFDHSTTCAASVHVSTTAPTYVPELHARRASTSAHRATAAQKHPDRPDRARLAEFTVQVAMLIFPSHYRSAVTRIIELEPLPPRGPSRRCDWPIGLLASIGSSRRTGSLRVHLEMDHTTCGIFSNSPGSRRASSFNSKMIKNKHTNIIYNT